MSSQTIYSNFNMVAGLYLRDIMSKLIYWKMDFLKDAIRTIFIILGG